MRAPGFGTLRFRWAATLLLAGLSTLLALGLAERFATRRAVDAEAGRARASAVLLVSGFRRELEKFRLVSLILSKDPDVVSAVSGGEAQQRALDRKFEALSAAMDGTTVYLLDVRGDTLAASNWRLPSSFVGSNYNFRPYFREALAQGTFEQFALGLASREPGLYIGRQVRSGDAVIGVLVVKIVFDALEAEWRRSGAPAFATNREGVILVTSVPQWRFQTTRPLGEETRRDLQRTFGVAALPANAMFAGDAVASLGSAGAYGKPFVDAVQGLPPDWSVHVVAATRDPVQAAVTSSRLFVLTSVMTLAALAGLALYRRRIVAAQAERAMALRLQGLNSQLVQANKLATLGQIAAGVGHEINQPVAAIGVYAENGVRLLEAGSLGEAEENFQVIGRLTHRIGSITRELRGFARRASGVTEPVSVDQSIQGSLLLLRDRLRGMNAVVAYPQAGSELQVLAEPVRLEQVLVNLLQNALDAAGEGAVVDIGLNAGGDTVEVSIGDNGPGLSQEARERLFQPFSTSKVEGLGLGLVISRDIMADFGGELVAGARPRGAEFILRLRRAP